jgi:hypothetical protein
VFDGDREYADDPNKRSVHERDNLAIQALCGVPSPVPFPDAPLWHDRGVMWSTNIGAELANEIGKDAWAGFRAKASTHLHKSA